MDQRRFIAFLVLAMAALMLSNLLFPQPKEQPKLKPPVAAADQGAAADAAKAQPGAGADQLAAGKEPGAAVAQVPLAGLDVAADAVPLELLTLGSVDSESGYRMLVTLSNAGAAVKRVELSSPRFHDLQDRSGYLGQLALESVDGGVKVTVVGAGTPAAAAGLAPGDIISQVTLPKKAAIPIKSVDEFHAAMADTKPGQEITLQVAHGSDAAKAVAVQLRERPLEVIRPEVENLKIRHATPPDGFVDPPSFLVGLAKLGGATFVPDADTKMARWLKDPEHTKEDPEFKKLLVPDQLSKWLKEGHWKLVGHDQSSATFEREIPDLKLKLTKRYTLTAAPAGSRGDENYPAYDFLLDVSVQNTGDAPQSVAYRLEGPNGLPVEGWWYAHKISQRWFSGAGLRDVAVRFHKSAELQIDCSAIASDKTEPMGGEGSSLAYVGVDGLYFSSIILPKKDSLDEDWFDSTEAVRVGPKPDPKTPLTYTNVSCRLTRKEIELQPGASKSDTYQVFIGPKYPELLAQYKAAGDPEYSLKDVIYYGMTPFAEVAQLMLKVLHFLHSIVGNFGLAIILLTVCVRALIFPISYKQAKSMARMQALKPEIDRITEKYKTDMQKRSQATQELYRKNKINPLGGCLPMFLQLPILIGLYRSIMIDAQLRQSPLFGNWTRWCSDLTAPDMLYDWHWLMPDVVNNGVGIFGLGPYFNLLPLITVSLFFVAQKLSMPPPTNDQAAMQQRMMKYMNVFILLIFYRSASGLCLYFIVSSLWGIGERKLLARNQAANGGALAPATATSRNGSPDKGKQASKKGKGSK